MFDRVAHLMGCTQDKQARSLNLSSRSGDVRNYSTFSSESGSEKDVSMKQARTVLIEIFAKGLARRVGDALDH